MSESFFFLKKKLTENIMQIQSYNNETLNDYIYFLRAIMQVGPDGSVSMAWDYASLWCNLNSLALERPWAGPKRCHYSQASRAQSPSL